MKLCVMCRREVPLEEFNRRVRSPDGKQNVCRECNRARARRYYAENKQKHIAVVMARTKQARALAQDFIGAYLLNHPCVDCGEEDVRVLDFDHRPGVEKTSDVMRLVRFGHSLEKIAMEMAKCEVRCRNCHAIVTYERADSSWRQRFARGQQIARGRTCSDGICHETRDVSRPRMGVTNPAKGDEPGDR